MQRNAPNKSAPGPSRGHQGDRKSLRFGAFDLDLDARSLRRNGEDLDIQRKPFEVLVYLLQEAPRLVSRRELLERFWSSAVNEEVLTRCISTLRKVLGDEAQPSQYIQTHRAQGYRFVADVSVVPDTKGRLPAAVSGNWPGRAAVLAALVLAALAVTAVWWPRTTDTSSEPIRRLAVMPISVASVDEPWLADALSAELMQAIASVEGITVVVARGLPADTPPGQLGRQLNVDAVLLTRLAPDAGAFRLGAELVATADARLVWSASVTSTAGLSDPGQIGQLTRRLAQRLRPSLQLDTPRRYPDARAYRHYLEGSYYLAERSMAGLDAASRAFDAALAEEPGYAAALAGAAKAWLLRPLYGAVPPRQALPQAKQLAQRALEHDPDNVTARAVLGAAAMQYDWDWSRADRLLREAVALNPNNATARQWLGELHCYRGKTDLCRRQIETALDLDPLSPVLNMQRGSVYLYAADYAEAVKRYEVAVDLYPRFAMGRYSLGLAYAGLGDWDAAIATYESVLAELGVEVVGGPLVYALAAAGLRERAELLLGRLESLAADRYVPPSKLAIAHLGPSNRAEARRAFEAAIDVRDDRLVYFAVDPHTRSLMDDPDFAHIVVELGLDAPLAVEAP